MQDLRNVSKSIYDILACPYLPYKSKLKLLWWKSRNHLWYNEHTASLRIGKYNIYLKPSHKPDIAVFHEIFIRHHYQTDYTDAIVLDLGAHKGFFSVYAIMEQAAVILSYEPEIENFRALKQSLSEHRSKETIIFIKREAVTDKDAGEVIFYVTDESWAHSLHQPEGHEKITIDKVMGCPFKDIISYARKIGGLKKNLIVKMDIEGSEHEVLRNTPTQYLSEINEMFIELHYTDSSIISATLQRLKTAGFLKPTYVTENVIHIKRANTQL
jgi:FkbM family methyltransferase